MALKAIFGTNLRQCRKARQMAQSELADQVRVSNEMISRLERGVTAPSFRTIEKLAEVLEVPEAAFFSRGVTPVGDAGQRGALLGQINEQLSHMNDQQLAQVLRLMAALAD